MARDYGDFTTDERLRFLACLEESGGLIRPTCQAAHIDGTIVEHPTLGYLWEHAASLVGADSWNANVPEDAEFGRVLAVFVGICRELWGLE